MAPQDKDGLKEAIIQASLELGTELGEEGLTMRAIARRLNVSATALYQHFDSKSSILKAIRMHGLVALNDALRPAFEGDDPSEALVEQGVRYVRFARENPWIYSVLVEHESLVWNDSTDEERDVIWEPQRRTVEAIQRAIDSGQLRDDLDPETIRLLLWAAVHGLASLMIGGRIRKNHPVFKIEDEDEFIREFVRNCLRGYRK